MDKATNFFDVKKEEEVVEEQSKNTPHKQTLSEFDRDEKYSKFRYDFPLPVGPVTRMIPWGILMAFTTS